MSLVTGIIYYIGNFLKNQEGRRYFFFILLFSPYELKNFREY